MSRTSRPFPRLANLVLISHAIAASVASAGQYAITADPPVSRPGTKPCMVQLFADFRFDDFSPRPFDYAPPADCPGPWAKVVLEGDFYVTAGRQFDRTANIWLGGANIYFGTTPEPSSTISPSWHFERDLTDYAPLFSRSQAGRVDLGNLVDPTYTGIIFGSVDVQLYPVDPSEDPLTTSDLVLPLSGSPTGGTVALQTSTDLLERSFDLPTNIERAYLDVVAQSQASDEFWYLCVPDEVRTVLRSCGGTGFRETEIAIDGQPAGVAPVYPWIFTGGIDPYLWRPIPGVQALNFVPYRVDLTPFAGLLSDGQAHSVAVRVFNANHNFATTASLLLYLDHGARQVTGGVTTNTLEASPTPDQQVDVSTVKGVTSGTVVIRSSRQFEIAGFVTTSHGRVDTSVAQNVDFSSSQEFNVTSTTFAQDLTQTTSISSVTTTTQGDVSRETTRQFDWPLTLSFHSDPRPDGSTARTTIIHEEYNDHGNVTEEGQPVFSSDLSSVMSTRDTLLLRGSTVIGREDQAASHQYFSQDSSGACYSRTINSEGGVVTEIIDGDRCTGG